MQPEDYFLFSVVGGAVGLWAFEAGGGVTWFGCTGVIPSGLRPNSSPFKGVMEIGTLPSKARAARPLGVSGPGIPPKGVI